MQLVLNPWQFDVILTTNLFDDILSDLMAGLVGGLGMAPGSNIGGGVSIESVESLFNQLADYAAGSPVAWRHAASPGRVALSLVVLREVMHHGGFRSVSLLGDTS